MHHEAEFHVCRLAMEPHNEAPHDHLRPHRGRERGSLCYLFHKTPGVLVEELGRIDPIVLVVRPGFFVVSNAHQSE